MTERKQHMETKNIRNICLIGHGNNGKTSLAESMLFCTGAIDRMGKSLTAPPYVTTTLKKPAARSLFPPLSLP